MRRLKRGGSLGLTRRVAAALGLTALGLVGLAVAPAGSQEGPTLRLNGKPAVTVGPGDTVIATGTGWAGAAGGIVLTAGQGNFKIYPLANCGADSSTSRLRGSAGAAQCRFEVQDIPAGTWQVEATQTVPFGFVFFPPAANFSSARATMHVDAPSPTRRRATTDPPADTGAPLASPDSFGGIAEAAPLHIQYDKAPNPLPTGTGPFALFDIPEARSELTSGQIITGRASLMFPGDFGADFPSLLAAVVAGLPSPPEYPLRAEAKYPIRQDREIGLRADSSGPLSWAVGSARAHADPSGSWGLVRMKEIVLRARSESAAARGLRAASADLRASAGSVPRSADEADQTGVLVSIDGATASSEVRPFGQWVVTRARSVLEGVNLIEGAIRIRSIVAESSSWTDGRGLTDGDSRVVAQGVTVAGQDAVLTEDGLFLAGSGAGNPLVPANSHARFLADRGLKGLADLDMSIRLGSVSRALEVGDVSTAGEALLMRLEFGPLTEPLPQPPDPLQQVYGAIQDAYRANDPFEQLTCAINTNICFRTPLPDALFVPDVTGSRDAVTFVIGRSATSLFADRFPSFDFGSGGGSTEFIGTGGETLVSGTGAVAEVPSEGVFGEIAAGPELGGLGTGSTLGGPVAAGTAGFGEDRFLGAAAPERFRALYLLGILVMAAVGVGGSFAIRALGR